MPALTDEPKFKIGDIVYLNSGSPKLTVSNTWKTTWIVSPGYITVSWVDDENHPQEWCLSEACFTKNLHCPEFEYNGSIVDLRKSGKDSLPQRPNGQQPQPGSDVTTTAPDRQFACLKLPYGWRCTRECGHEGPCAAVLTEDVKILKAYGSSGDKFSVPFDKQEGPCAAAPDFWQKWLALFRWRVPRSWGYEVPCATVPHTN